MKDKKKLILTIILSLVAVVIFMGAYLMLNSNYTPESEGSIEVLLIDLDGTTVKEKTIEFYEGDSLLELLKANFDNVVVENGMLMTIDTFTTASDWSTFISIYVNDEMSMVGLLDIPFENGMKISFVMTEYVANYE